jgi:O-methyltransferase involved in polyketide biosynthesis
MIVRRFPSTPLQVKALRWFLKFAVQQLAAQGYTQFLDLASGLPTVDHIHETTPAGTRVLYSDNDPIVVAYGQEIIGDHPHVRFVQADCRRPAELLELPVVRELFGDDHRVVVGFCGVVPYVEPDEIRHTMRVLYDWAAPGSRLLVSTAVQMVAEVRPAALEWVAYYRDHMQAPFHVWTLPVLLDLLLPWQPDEQGFRPCHDWLGVADPWFEQEIRAGTGWISCGAILRKEAE